MLCHQDINRLNDSQQSSKFAVHITKTANVISSTETFFFWKSCITNRFKDSLQDLEWKSDVDISFHIQQHDSKEILRMQGRG
jgi:hypothetical protein